MFRGKYWKIHNFFSTNNIFDAKIKNKQLVNKYNISGFTNNTGLNEKIKTLATKTKLKADQVKIENFKLMVFQLILNTFTTPTIRNNRSMKI